MEIFQAGESAHAVKKCPLTDCIPVILMTTDNNRGETIMKESEADDILIKPFDITRLEELLYRFSQKH